MPPNHGIYMRSIIVHRLKLLNPHLRHIFRNIIALQCCEYLRAEMEGAVVGGHDGGGNVVRLTRLEVAKFNQRLVILE